MPPVRAARQSGLDALRAAASLAVVVLHASVAYMLYPWPDLLWAAKDQPSPLADAVGWGIQGCAMPVFFVLSGYFAAGIVAGRSPGQFLKHRFQRLILPLLSSMPTVLVLTGYVWVGGWVAAGHYPLRKLRSFSFEPHVAEHLWGLGHLWYLEYLFLDCVLLAVGVWLAGKWRASRRAPQRDPSVPWSPAWLPLAFITPAAVILWYDPAIVIGFQNTLTPIPTKLAYYFLYFVAGAAARRMWPDRTALASTSLVPLVSAGLCFCFALPMIHSHLLGELSPAARFGMALVLVAYAWLMAWGLFRLALAWGSGVNRAVQYVADASYWVYLTHLPIVGLAQVSLTGVAWPSEIKFALATLAGWSLTLLTYEAWVRRTWVGVWLDGQRRPAAPAASTPFRLSIFTGEEAEPEPQGASAKAQRKHREAA